MTVSNTKIAGVDEVGRGSLFGPVFAGAVILHDSAVIALTQAGLADSKALSARKRARLVPLIEQASSSFALGQASAREIDSIGIRVATERAMIRALDRLPQPLDLVLVDGALPIRLWEGPQLTIIKGDSKCPSISAASILAKEARDKLIKRLANTYSGYGLERHVGYGTLLHRQAIAKCGPTPLHRRSFLSKVLRT
mgnify:CR=1 FL=1